jgi:hypothetical protein
MKLKPDLSEGRGVAYVGLLVGITISVAGNIGHAYVPPIGESRATWTPGAGIVASAVIWPIMLFLTLEIMLNIRWPDEWYIHVVRWGVLGVVAFVAAFVSYQHLSGLLRYWDETKFAWHYGPLAVDGLLTMSTTALIVIKMNLASTPDLAPAPVTVPAKKAEKKLAPRPPTAPIAPVPTPVPVPVPTPNGNDQHSGNAKLILDALPGTVNNLVDRTGVKRTTVDYVLKKTLADSVRQDDDRIWHRVPGSS